MRRELSLSSIVRSEWIKFRTVRSTLVGVSITFVLTLGLGALVTSLVRAHWNSTNLANQLTFDPVERAWSA